METFENLSRFLRVLSRRTQIKFHFKVENFEDSILNAKEKSILKGLNGILESSDYFGHENLQQKCQEENVCKVCHKKFAHLQLLNFHTQSVHEKSNPSPLETKLDFHACLSCNQCFKTSTDFEESHSAFCDFKLRIPKELLAFHNQYSCGICKSKFKSLSRIGCHLEQCQKAEEFSCPHCQKSQESHMELCQHLATIHSLEKPFQCQFCASNFKFKSSLNKHIFKKHNKKKVENNFQCDSCPKRFIKKVYLTNHKLKFHGLKKPLLCPQCGHQFLTLESMKKHQKEKHFQTKNNEFQCHLCSKLFQRKDKLNNHLLIHSGNRPFQCDLCPKRFITKCKLNDHQKRHYGEQKRFNCLLCPNKAYAGSHDLRKHLEKMHPKVAEKMVAKMPIIPQFITYMQTTQNAK